MFCRAKISVVLFVAGTLTGWAAPLPSAEKNPAFARNALPAPVVLKPAQTKASVGTPPRWRAGQAPKIIRPAQAVITEKKVEKVVSGGLLSPVNSPSSAVGSSPARSVSEEGAKK